MPQSGFRLLCSFLFLILFNAGALSAVSANQAAVIAGVVVDETDAPIARVRVRLINPSGADVEATVTNDRGRFRLRTPPCAGCRIDAALAGFITATTTMPASGEARLVLTAAPVRESVVVTANRNETPTSQVGSAVTVFDRESIARRGTPLASELLRATPGATVVGTGGLGNVTSLFVRGGESDYNKVLLDGIPLNEPGGTFNFGNLTTGGLERIEVVRGAQSALFGSDAMSSVVQLVSARGRVGTRPTGEFRAEGGSYGTSRFQAGLSGGARQWDYAFHAGRFDTDNRAPNNDFTNTTVTLNTGGTIGADDRLSLRGVVRLERENVGSPGQTAFGRPDSDAFFDRHDIAGVSFDHRVNSLWRQSGALAVSRSLQTSTNLFEDPPYTPAYEDRTGAFEFFDFLYDTRNDLRRYHFSYQSDWRLGAPAVHGSQIITAALDVNLERATLDDRLADTLLELDRNNVGLTLQHQFAGSRLSTSAGVRFEHNGSFGNEVVPRGSVAYFVGHGRGIAGDTTLRASAGLGVKEPTMLESFGQSFFAMGNPDLLPERSRSVDVGVEQRLFDQRARVELTWFDATYRDQISTRTVDPATFASQYFNIGRTSASGLELSGEIAPVRWFGARAGYTFLASEIVDATSTNVLFQPGAWTFRRPRHSGFLDAWWTYHRVSLDLSAVFAGRRVDSDFAALVLPITESNLPAIWKFGARVRATERLELFLRVENVTNHDYMDPPGYPAWQRTAHGGVRVTF